MNELQNIYAKNILIFLAIENKEIKDKYFIETAMYELQKTLKELSKFPLSKISYGLFFCALLKIKYAFSYESEQVNECIKKYLNYLKKQITNYKSYQYLSKITNQKYENEDYSNLTLLYTTLHFLLAQDFAYSNDITENLKKLYYANHGIDYIMNESKDTAFYEEEIKEGLLLLKQQNQMNLTKK